MNTEDAGYSDTFGDIFGQSSFGGGAESGVDSHREAIDHAQGSAIEPGYNSDVEEADPLGGTGVGAAKDNVVDLTLSDPEVDESDDEVEVIEHKRSSSLSKRELPNHFLATDDYKRPRFDLPSSDSSSFGSYSGAYGSSRGNSIYDMNFGQEMSFAILSKQEVEVKWSGREKPNKEVVGFINHMLRILIRKKPPRMRPIGRDRFALHIQEYRDLERKVSSRLGVITVQIPEMALNSILLSSDGSNTAKLDEKGEKMLLDRLPKRLCSILADFQKVGVHWGAILKEGRCLIADEPGLGKTIQSIAVAACFFKEWPLLVITPSSARYHWETEVVKWLQDDDEGDWVNNEEVQVLLGASTKIRSKIKALIVSYDLVDRIKTAISLVNEGTGFKVIIADECHMLKNRNTKRAKAILPMLRKARRSILLSGTPALSRPKELWSQLNVINAQQWGSFNDFVKRYCCADNRNDEANGGESFKKKNA